MPEANLHIEKLKLRVRGVDASTARALASGLGEAIASAVDVESLMRAGNRRLGRLDLGSVTATPGATADGLRVQVAASIGQAVSRPGESRAGGGA
jgi:hypothetical protein